MPKHKLDASFCLTAQCRPGKRKTDYYDTTVTGFVLECRASGGKSYYLRFQDQHGGQRQHLIAAYGDVTFDKARKEAIRLRSEIVLGGDPARKKAEKRAVPLYGDLADQHIAHARTYARSIKSIEGYMEKHIRPRWGRTRLTDIHPQDVSRWLAEKRESGLAPATVEKIRVIFGRSFELAARWNMAGADKNPIKGVSRPRFSNARERFLSAAEAARLREAVAASRNTQLSAIVNLLLLTGARVSELLKAEHRHIDVDRRAWFIPDSKTGKSRHVPLSQPAIDIIVALPRFGDCPYLVPNPDTRQPFASIQFAWDTARRRAKLQGFRLHDLRHSAASFMANSGVDLFTIGKVLGHSSYQSTQRYSHLANDTLLAAVEAGARKQNAGAA